MIWRIGRKHATMRDGDNLLMGVLEQIASADRVPEDRAIRKPRD